MLVEDSQCAANITGFGSHSSVDIVLTVIQGVISFLSIIGSVLLILSYAVLRRIRSKSRVLITHLAAANFLQALSSFVAVFMNFRTRFKVTDQEWQFCSSGQIFDSSVRVYCNLCIYLEFFSLIGTLSTIFWTVFVCIHFFILVSYRNTKLASRVTYIYYVTAWFVPLGICLWLLFHNWLGFEPTYSTVNCSIKTDCVPHHHPYSYKGKNNWNRVIGVLFGIKIWQVLVFLLIPCLFVAIQCKNRKHVSYDAPTLCKYIGYS